MHDVYSLYNTVCDALVGFMVVVLVNDYKVTQLYIVWFLRPRLVILVMVVFSCSSCWMSSLSPPDAKDDNSKSLAHVF